MTAPLAESIFLTRRDRRFGFAAAAGIHLLLFTVGSAVITKPAQFGVEAAAGAGGVEISFVEERPAAMSESAVAAVPDAADFPATEERKIETPSVEPAPSFQLAGVGGSTVEAKPHYLRNAAPSYPEPARKNGEEGLVLLSAEVSRTGRPGGMRVKQSSGYPLLDKAALDAVRRWRFEPARLGGMAIESEVEVPIRFRLKN